MKVRCRSCSNFFHAADAQGEENGYETYCPNCKSSFFMHQSLPIDNAPDRCLICESENITRIKCKDCGVHFDLYLLEKGLELQETDYHEAINCFNKVLLLDPHNEKVRLARASIYLKLRSFEWAILFPELFEEEIGESSESIETPPEIPIGREEEKASPQTDNETTPPDDAPLRQLQPQSNPEESKISLAEEYFELIILFLILILLLATSSGRP